MKTCSACGYQKKPGGQEKISFHTFPKKENIRQAWIEVMGLENVDPTRNSVLCSQHFSEECFYYSMGGMKQRTYL
ncbi:THAP domain-containing protein 1-like, partial [Mycetomoellerius zeteki]|uniref:THAP domain-containing protein 1-like n=1 Tax=Mycetomoellerius zeteki TaxID=64791 RepID=UPI00084E45C3